MRIKTLVAVYFWILEFDDVTCIRSIPNVHNGGTSACRHVTEYFALEWGRVLSFT